MGDIHGPVMPTTIETTPRIAIYGTGQFGTLAAKIAVQKGWSVVAAFNRAGPKVGQDLGVLMGLDDELGVVVQDCDTADYAAVDADVGIVAVSDRLRHAMPGYRRLIGAGMNVICHAVEASFPYGADPDLAAEIDAIAKANDVSFLGTSLWDMSRIWSGILVAGPCTEITALHHTTHTAIEGAGKALMLMCGVGMTVDEFTRKMVDDLGPIGGLYKLVPQHVLTALGYTVTKVTEHREPIIFDEAVYCRPLEEDIPAGICVGTRILAEVETAEGVTADSSNELRVFKPGEKEHMIWEVDGLPASKIRVDRRQGVWSSSSSMINRVPDVIAAEPGIRLMSELGVMHHTALVRP